MYLDSRLCTFYFSLWYSVRLARKQQQERWAKKEEQPKIECGAKVCVSLKGKTPIFISFSSPREKNRNVILMLHTVVFSSLLFFAI